ncbi:MAG TPA: hypothetical protein VNS81_09415 [Nocardioides sp.]|nr:hypothetical protein [Nocardioides sp.]
MTTLERARRLAGEQPEGPVPCPVCAAEVKGGNLDRHLAKVHEGDGDAHDSRWSGPERIGSRRLLGLALVVVVATAAYVAITGDQDDRVIFGAGVLLAVSMVVWGAVAWGAPLFPGRLRVDSRGALLRHSYGLGRRRLRSVDVVVLGSAWESRPSGSGSDGTYASST